MLTHPDPQTNAIFAMLQQQRDDAIIQSANAMTEVAAKNAALAKAKEEFEGLKAQVEALQAAQTDSSAAAPATESNGPNLVLVSEQPPETDTAEKAAG